MSIGLWAKNQLGGASPAGGGGATGWYDIPTIVIKEESGGGLTLVTPFEKVAEIYENFVVNHTDLAYISDNIGGAFIVQADFTRTQNGGYSIKTAHMRPDHDGGYAYFDKVEDIILPNASVIQNVTRYRSVIS
jgi:hypothetical protein